jgi:hypothetical protein
MELTLSEQEQDLLLHILENRHQAMLNEIAHTDRREFKQELRKDEEVLDSLVSRLRGTGVPAFR